jgi:hypothetical protein
LAGEYFPLHSPTGIFVADRRVVRGLRIKLAARGTLSGVLRESEH